MAALLSIVPGLGHVYKGYRGIGLLFAIGTLIVLGFSGLAAIASAGFGLGLAVFYWVGVAMHAYAIKDRVVPSEKDEGEQY
jgi:apolipoprotein N-acyltransferase